MKEQLIRLQQKNRTAGEYAMEFLRLSQFAPYMVTDEENWASRSQHGLKMKIQMFVITKKLKKFSQVLTFAREVDWGLKRNIRKRWRRRWRNPRSQWKVKIHSGRRTPRYPNDHSNLPLSRWYVGAIWSLRTYNCWHSEKSNSRQLFNRSEWYLTCRHLKKISRRQTDSQILPTPKG